MIYQNSQHLAPRITPRIYPLVMMGREEATLFPELVFPAKELTAPYFRETSSIKEIQFQECKRGGITLEAMLSQRKSRQFSQPRMIAMARCVDETRFSSQTIALAFDRVNHTTVLHAHKKYGKKK